MRRAAVLILFLLGGHSAAAESIPLKVRPGGEVLLLTTPPNCRTSHKTQLMNSEAERETVTVRRGRSPCRNLVEPPFEYFFRVPVDFRGEVRVTLTGEGALVIFRIE